MSGREAQLAARAAARAVARAAELERTHAAIRMVTDRALAGQMAYERACALTGALLLGHAIAQVVPTVDPGKSRLSIVVSPNAPPEVRALLEQAQAPEIPPVERDMMQAAAPTLRVVKP